MCFKKKSIVDFYDVSILIACYDCRNLNRMLSDNSLFFTQNGVELVLSTDESSLPDILHIVQEFPLMNFKIVSAGYRSSVQDKIATALFYAEYRYVILAQEGDRFLSDVIYQLLFIINNNPGCCAISCLNGLPIPAAAPFITTRKLLQDLTIPTGISTFDVLFFSICKALETSGQKMLLMEEIMVQRKKSYSDEHQQMSCGHHDHKQGITPPISSSGNGRLVYHWMYNKMKSAQQHILQMFSQYYYDAEDVFDKEYEVICLIQVRNEIKHIPEVLDHIGQYCDGIILLDDGSTDGTYENSRSAKLVLKLGKRHEGRFNDLNNRNLLLYAAHLFKSKWFFFMDADERFDPLNADLRPLTKMEDVDVINFRMVHLWDSKKHYRQDIPEGIDGVIRRYRMFRNKGFMQIHYKRELHFSSTPFKRNIYHAPILLHHYGIMEMNIRKTKFEQYNAQDPGGKNQGYPYDYLLDENVQLRLISKLKLKISER